MTVRYQEIKRDYESISHLISNRDKRAAWFGAVGVAFKHIFGTLDEDDALKYESAIDSLQKDDKKLAQLMKENVLIATSALNSYKSSIEKLNVNQDILSRAINQIINYTKNVTQVSNVLTLESRINSVLTNLESSMLTLSFQLEDLVNALTLCSQNILHPCILTPAQLYRELVDNSRHLPGDMQIPLPLSLDSVHSILNICNVACYYYMNKLVFVLQVPLVTNEEFNLYKNLASPTPHSVENADLFSFITPSSLYTAISKDKISFCSLDSLDKCKLVHSELFVCEIPTVWLVSGKPTCESELLTKTFNVLPVQCKAKTIFGELDIWKPLMNNRWIFVQSRSSKISMDCGTPNLREVIITGTGILNVPKQCTVYTKSARLIPSNNVLNLSIASPMLDFSIINDSCCKLDYKPIDSNIVPPILQNIDLDDLTIRNFDNNLIPELNKIISKKPLLVRYGTPYFIFTMVISLIVMCFISYKIYKTIRRRSSKFRITFVKATPAAEDAVNNDEPRENLPAPSPRLRVMA